MYMSHVPWHVSRVICPMSHVTCHNFFGGGQSGEAYSWVCCQRGLPRPVCYWRDLISLTLSEQKLCYRYLDNLSQIDGAQSWCNLVTSDLWGPSLSQGSFPSTLLEPFVSLSFMIGKYCEICHSTNPTRWMLQRIFQLLYFTDMLTTKLGIKSRAIFTNWN